MDLNDYTVYVSTGEACWLPRGAMDLNPHPLYSFAANVTLAPSWSHGSKWFRIFPCVLLFSWLPRGAMDLNDPDYKVAKVVACWLPRGAMDLNCKPL